MQPIILIAIVGVAAVTLSTGFLMPSIGWFNLQGVSVNERDFSAPLDHANVDIEVSKISRVITDSEGNTHNAFFNIINECSFHTPDPGGLGPGATIICKLTDDQHDVVAEGRIDLPNGLDKSERTVIPIMQTAFDLANEIQNINDIKLIVLGGNPTNQLCAMLEFDTCVDFDGITSTGRGISVGTTEAFLGATIIRWNADGPTGGTQGIDVFDFDGNGIYNLSMDAIHLEDPAGACNTGVRNGQFVLGSDCIVVDVSAMLFNLAPVSCDLEFGAGVGACRNLAFFDSGGALGQYDNTEDIFIDSGPGGVPDGILN